MLRVGHHVHSWSQSLMVTKWYLSLDQCTNAEYISPYLLKQMEMPPKVGLLHYINLRVDSVFTIKSIIVLYERPMWREQYFLGT